LFFTGHNPENCLIIISAGFDAHHRETAWMQRHGRNVPDSFFHEFMEEILKAGNQYCQDKVISVLEGGYSEAALTYGIAGMLGH